MTSRSDVRLAVRAIDDNEDEHNKTATRSSQLTFVSDGLRAPSSTDMVDIFHSSSAKWSYTSNITNKSSQQQPKQTTNTTTTSWSFDNRSGQRSYNYYNRDMVNTGPTSPNKLDEADGVDSHSSGSSEPQDEQERLASLEALRLALYQAPFCRNMHTLMSVPNEECYEMIGIPTKCAIRIEQLCYGNLLDNVNLEVPKGKIYALLGSTNNGKSVLLKCMLGRQQPTSGQIVVFGQRPSNSPLSAICVGYMPQRVSLHRELTIEQTLFYYGRLYQLPQYMVCERITMLDSMFEGCPNQQSNNDTDKHSIRSTTLVGDLDESNLWRLSLVVAMIHSPPLLLLDEPTDNVDPLVRNTVWSHLQKLCDKEGLTIVFTTKHPEELSYAYKAGLMRDGHVYVEDRPEELLRSYHSQTYIQMYNKFCMSNTPRRIRPSLAPFEWHVLHQAPSQLSYQTCSQSLQSHSVIEEQHNPDLATNQTWDQLSDQTNETIKIEHNLTTIQRSFSLIDQPNQDDRTSVASCYSDGSVQSGHRAIHERLPLPMAEWPIAERRRTAFIRYWMNFDFERFLSLLLKNFYVILQGNSIPILFYLMFPMMQIILVGFIFDRLDVSDMPVTVKRPVKIAWMNQTERDKYEARMARLTTMFIDRRVFVAKTDEDEDDSQHLSSSLDTVRKGQSWALIEPWSIEQYMPSPVNYNCCTSQCERWLYRYNQLQDPKHMFGIRLYVDNSNYFLHHLFNYSFISSMRELVSDEERLLDLFSPECPELYSTMKYQDPFELDVVYGPKKIRLLEFILPGFLISIIFAHSVVLTSYLFIKEEIQGLQERCLTAGASGIEILSSHMISQGILFAIQECLLILLIAKGFAIQCRALMACTLVAMQGITGIAFGLFIAVICPRPVAASLFTTAIFIPGFFLTGIIWPVESMPKEMAYISRTLPLTLPIDALRFIISRGKVNFQKIWPGYAVSSIYIATFTILALAIFKFKTSS